MGGGRVYNFSGSHCSPVKPSQDWMMEMEADEFMESPEFLASSAERSVGQAPGDQGGISPGAAAGK